MSELEVNLPDWLEQYIAWHQKAMADGQDGPQDAFRAGYIAGLLAAAECAIKTTTNGRDTQTAIQPWKDWKRLLMEAQAGRDRSIHEIANFIADNTADPRADGPPDTYTFAPGYHDMIESWLRQEGISDE